MKTEMLEAMKKEIGIQKDYLNGDLVETIYFGGGTPSVLTKAELSELFEAIYSVNNVSEDVEITLEANPDDLTKDYLYDLKDSGVNRLSIGVQSFFDEDLVWMNRSHNAIQAESCLKEAQDLGLENISIDLIFGNPSSQKSTWITNLERAYQIGIKHLSCYGLTVEPRTALKLMIEKGKTEAPREEDYSEQFLTTMELLESWSYIHYEISNYSLDGMISKHNSNYWKGVAYLGLGPSAHSYNGNSRQWNTAHNIKYLKAIESGESFYEEEILSSKDKFNEYLMTGLRTIWGVEKDKLEELNPEFYDKFCQVIKKQLNLNNIIFENGVYKLSRKGKLLANSVISELFIV
jgi:oxygen-independent coproporphyrinogen-3 oxidase